MILRLAPIVLLSAALQDPPSVADRLVAGRWRTVDDLVRAGAESKDALRAVSESDNEDAAWYAKAALAELEALEASGAADPVRCEAAEASPANEAAAALFRLAGRTASLDAVSSKPVTLPAGLPFLEALDRIGREAGIEFTCAADGTWSAAPAAGRSPRFAFRSVRARIDGVLKETRASFEADPSTKYDFRGRILGDGGPKPTTSNISLKVIEAVDENGRPVPKSSSSTGGRTSFRQRGAVDVDFNFSIGAPEAGVTKLKRLRATGVLTYEKKRDSFTFEKVLESENLEKTVGDVTARLKSVKQEGEEIRVSLEITSTSAVQWPSWDEILLTDKAGGEYQRWGSSASSGSKKATFNLSYRNPGGLTAPEKVVFSMVTETYRKTVYLEFEDVPLQ